MRLLIYLYLIVCSLAPTPTFAAAICRETYRADLGNSVSTENVPGFLIQDNCSIDRLSLKVSQKLTILAGKEENLPSVIHAAKTAPRHWEILFDLDRADLDSDDLTVLKTIPSGMKVRVDGYTCRLGEEEYNRELSFRRAATVTRFLQGHGVKVIVQEGLGECCPVSETNLARNRRVIIVEEK